MASERAKWEVVQAQYFKLSRALNRSAFLETDLLARCRELKSQLVETALQLQVAKATKIEDGVTIENLRRQMERAIARSEVLLVREQAAKKLITDLQQVSGFSNHGVSYPK